MNQTSKAKLLLHPVRMKIAQALINGRELSAQQLSERIDGVPPATLYRHINKLLEAEIIEVVQENPIRGTVEKIYALKQTGAATPEDLEKISKEEHLDLFAAFTNQLAGMYEDYLNQEAFNLIEDGVGYRLASVHLTDEEFIELMGKMASLMVEAMEKQPSPERRTRHIATITIPDPEK
ncbi:helix-turn-helix domain-containing protein [Metabacillus sp. KIGAM252]|uniref:Helix-turn-helix domain-containing protein n=1 Tax=Metabacillus flavus TaxID=2823519 RepID=A0ABS5LB58_9BACI|nr:helix-turn-helix domain-containing protein [Metabacillus flavus]MBS2967773.1 helix-turn-helix domain-containing protein [Metabacillus flavus]